VEHGKITRHFTQGCNSIQNLQGN